MSSDRSKLPWLKVDFARWKNEDDDEDSDPPYETTEQERIAREIGTGKFPYTYGDRVDQYTEKVSSYDAASYDYKRVEQWSNLCILFVVCPSRPYTCVQTGLLKKSAPWLYTRGTPQTFNIYTYTSRSARNDLSKMTV